MLVGEPPDGIRIRAELRQRVFAGAMGTCVLDWRGQVLKAVGRHHDFAALPESGPVWVRWAAEDARWVRP